jgi:hypothetical protein
MEFIKVKQYDYVPTGEYVAQFLGVKTMENSVRNRRDENGLPVSNPIMFRFMIGQGEYARTTVVRVTPPLPTSGNSCGRMLDGLAGRTLVEGEPFDPDTVVGELYRILVDVSHNPRRTHVVQILGKAESPPASPVEQ